MLHRRFTGRIANEEKKGKKRISPSLFLSLSLSLSRLSFGWQFQEIE